MILEIDTLSVIPIYQQLRDQVILGMAKGELLPGESLPTVRQLADELGVNTMTISKAYNLLKDEGYLITDRRKGSLMRLPEAFTVPEETALHQALALLLAQGKLHGVSREHMLDAVNEIWQSFDFKGGENDDQSES